MYAAAISPDGNSVAYMDYQPTKADGGREGTAAYGGFELVVIDLATGSEADAGEREGREAGRREDVSRVPGGVRWSPDGTRVAFAHDFAIVGGITEWRLKSVAADGTDAKTVFTIDRKADGKRWKPYALVDWR